MLYYFIEFYYSDKDSMNTEPSIQDKGLFNFIEALSQLLTHQNIEHNAYQWGEFVSETTGDNTQQSLFILSSRIFDIQFSPVDLSNILPENQGYLVHHGIYWVFSTDINAYEADEFKGYVVRKKEKMSLSFSLNPLSFMKNKNLMMIFSLSFLINIFALTSPLYFNAIYGRIIPSAAESSLWTLSIIAFLCFFCEYLLKRSKAHYGFNVMESYKNQIQPEMLKNIMAQSYSTTNDWGRKKENALRDLKELGTLFWGILSTNLFDVFFVLLFLFVIYLMAGALVVMPIIVLLVLLGIGVYHSYYIKEKPFPYIQFISTSTIDHYRMSGVETRLASVNLANENSLYQFNKQAQSEKQGLSALLAFIASAQSIFITVLAFFLIQHNDISIASLFAVIILSSRVSQSMVAFIHTIPLIKKIHEKMVSVNEFVQQGDIQQHLELDDITDYQWTVHDVTLAFDEKKPLFKNIHFRFKQGEKIAFIGHQGLGKTTLSKLLMGLLQPGQGQITVQDQHGHQVPLSALNQRVHYQPQWPFMFGGSLMTHLCAEKTYAEEVCKNALLQPYLRWLPPLLNNGLYTQFHHLPFELSPIQKQYLSLPRFMLTEKDIWVFDDPLLLVDNTVKQKFIKLAQDKMTPETTLLLFTDNLQYIDLVERVIAFNDGSVIFDGSKSDFIQHYAQGKNHE